MKKNFFMLSLLFLAISTNAQNFGSAKPKNALNKTKQNNNNGLDICKQELNSVKQKNIELTSTIAQWEQERVIMYTQINKYKKLSGHDTSGMYVDDKANILGFDPDLNLKVLYAIGDKKTQNVYIVFLLDNPKKIFHQEISFDFYYYNDNNGKYVRNSWTENFSYKRVDITIIDNLGYINKLNGSTILSILPSSYERNYESEFQRLSAFFTQNGLGDLSSSLKTRSAGNGRLAIGENYSFCWGFSGVSPVAKYIEKLTFGYYTKNEGKDEKDPQSGLVSNMITIKNIPIIWYN